VEFAMRSSSIFSLFLAVFSSVALSSNLSAAIISFDLIGRAGPGLLPGNEIGTITSTATGGENGLGIFFDDVSNVLTINVGWGTNDGFLGALTGNATAMHLHGPAGINSNAGILVGLDSLAGYSNAANGGGFNGTVTLSAANETHLLAGNLYINIHTAANGGGELRANLIAVPEPTSLLLVAGASLALARRRRR
jgi:hypothetical protein